MLKEVRFVEGCEETLLGVFLKHLVVLLRFMLKVEYFLSKWDSLFICHIFRLFCLYLILKYPVVHSLPYCQLCMVDGEGSFNILFKKSYLIVLFFDVVVVVEDS